MRLVVVGGGIVGTHLAAELASRGASVTLIDRGEQDGSTSEGSFAWINCSNTGVDYLDLRVRGVEAWAKAEVDFEQPSWLALTGTLTWADAEATTSIERHGALLERLGHRLERITPAQARRDEPDL